MELYASTFAVIVVVVVVVSEITNVCQWTQSKVLLYSRSHFTHYTNTMSNESAAFWTQPCNYYCWVVVLTCNKIEKLLPVNANAKQLPNHNHWNIFCLLDLFRFLRFFFLFVVAIEWKSELRLVLNQWSSPEKSEKMVFFWKQKYYIAHSSDSVSESESESESQLQWLTNKITDFTNEREKKTKNFLSQFLQCFSRSRLYRIRHWQYVRCWVDFVLCANYRHVKIICCRVILSKSS